jgi:hypothetical protein
MSQANVTWGAPRIRNELAKLGIEVAVSTVAKHMPRRRKQPSSTWRAFLENHVKDLVAIDFFVVPTATFGVLFGLIVLAHDRRRVVHFNATAHPTAEWTARQLIETSGAQCHSQKHGVGGPVSPTSPRARSRTVGWRGVAWTR